ncbi:hypothetical protein FV226_04525 [Methylobacterium sp. WL12]|nr:hypothetical protein FV226_04525 [Methylobacterium sp. WL12]
MQPPHRRLPPRFADDEVGKALSPRAGRGDAHKASARSGGVRILCPNGENAALFASRHNSENCSPGLVKAEASRVMRAFA